MQRLRSFSSDLNVGVPAATSIISRLIADHPVLPLVQEVTAAAARSHGRVDLRPLHAHVVVSGLIRDVFAASRIVQLFLSPPPNAAPDHDLRYADSIFASLSSPDVYTWNAMIAAHADRGAPASAVAFYFRMRARLATPNAHTFALLVRSCIVGVVGGSLLSLGQKIHGQVTKCGAEGFVVVNNSLMRMYCTMDLVEEARQLFDRSSLLDTVSWNTMISAYGKNGNIDDARILFDRMPERNLVSWSAIIDGYVNSENYATALSLFDEMEEVKIKPDAVTLVTVLKACALSGMLDRGRRIHSYIDMQGMRKCGNVLLDTALVDMYSKCGCIDEALQVFDDIRNGDVVLWNAMISGLALHGHGMRALNMFEIMKSKGIKPNRSTFIAAMSACTHVGMVDEGKRIFESMMQYDVEPQREHYGCLADLFGRAGLVEEAEEVLLKMPMEPHASQWGALMSSCRMHKNVVVGERVGKHLIALEPHDGGRYVVMADMYATTGRFEDAGAIRTTMEDKGAMKETGCSFIEGTSQPHVHHGIN